ncbi:MAG: PAS domain-containing protein [Desulfuromonadales bacterium]|nr:PAS domain-containing protein [Desulfuromonadales bacterium]
MTTRKKKLIAKPETLAPEEEVITTEAGTQNHFPIVGIGASAGGLAAFEAFFSGMPADKEPGMAFVLVQHLAPDHRSILAELVQRYTRLQVFEITDGLVIRPNCVYIIPPNHDIALLNGALHLLEPTLPRGQRMPIDFFFRSMSQDQHERAICIVLSGTASDGTLGVREIKRARGMVMVQNPESTEYDGMPRSAINTGLVDYVLPPAEMPDQLIAYVAHAFGSSHVLESVIEPTNEKSLKKIFIILRDQTGNDFSQYKPSTIYRRIERRMAVTGNVTMVGYVKHLQQTPTEVDVLFRDFLIGVTTFFRDPEAFLALEKEVIPSIFTGKAAGGVIRVWAPGCSTGEEAYSIAILLQERMESLKQSYTVQIFATDIDSRAIATARSGLYPASIVIDLSPDRLARFFVADPGGCTYRIHKGIRDMIVFSEHNVSQHPPFSKIDLISCRNLLIYMSGDLQKKLIPLFHCSLNPDGILFLGTSENIGEFDDFFTVLDRTAKLYQRKEYTHGARRAPLGRFLPSMTAVDATLRQSAAKTAFPVKLPLRELTEQALLQQIAPAGALVNSHGDILYLHGRSGMYLEPAQGEAGINNILKMAREGLQRELAIALHKAAEGKEIVRALNLCVKTNGHFTKVNLSIRPVVIAHAAIQDTPLFLVVLEEAPPSDLVRSDPSLDTDARIIALERELRVNEQYLQSTNEAMESFGEELKSSNEEMQSVNEELQSTNEELETSQEELQSVNEELATVNAELQIKVTDLSQTYNDMNNLLAGSNIGTVFVDHQLRILRFTPAASEIINLIPSDVGRPVRHTVSNMVGYNNLVADIKVVLNTLVSKEIEVQTTEGKWYTMRLQPYYTLDNVIEGAVITFVDITEMKATRDALEKANELLRLAVVVRDSHDAITAQDLDGRILAWNPAAVRMYGWSEAEALAMNVRDRIPEPLRMDALSKIHSLSRFDILEPFCTERIAKDGAVMEVWLTASALVNEAGLMYAIATTERSRERDEIGVRP